MLYLSMREQDFNEPGPSYAAQAGKTTGVGVMAEEIEQPNGDGKGKEVTIEELNEHLMRTQRREPIISENAKARVMAKAIKQLKGEKRRKDVTIGKLNEEVMEMKKEARIALEELQASIAKKSIDQPNDEMKYKEVTIGQLNEELTRTKKEATKALEEGNTSETLKFKEIASFKSIVDDLIRKQDSIAIELAILKADLTSKDTQLKESHSIIASMTNSNFKEEKLQSLHSPKIALISSLQESKKDHANKFSVVKLEIDQLKTRSENLVSAFQESKHLSKFTVKKNETIEQQKNCVMGVGMEKKLAERVFLIDETALQTKKSDDELQQTHNLENDLQKDLQSPIQGIEKMKTILRLRDERKNKEKYHQENLQNQVVIQQGKGKNTDSMRSSFIELKKQGTSNTAFYLYLKDKVERQEKYLKKRLEQDRRRKLLSSRPLLNMSARR